MTRLREAREAAGLTQAGLAARAGVSRQLVGAAEAGRHLPRVDAALALAQALGVDVGSLFARPGEAVDVATGSAPVEGSLLRIGRVGDRLVSAPVRSGPDGWDAADGLVEVESVTEFGRRAPGFVVVGCEPGLTVLERILREQGMAAISVSASSEVAVSALNAGRAHAAVVHGPGDQVARDQDLERFRLARWQMGLAASADAKPGWVDDALAGLVPVVQREAGAGVQRSFEEAAGQAVPGPRVGSHLEAALRAVLTGMPAVTIEPAALAAGAVFHPLEVHEAQVWVERRWMGERSVVEALEVISGQRFQRRLAAVGGYELSGSGDRAA